MHLERTVSIHSILLKLLHCCVVFYGFGVVFNSCVHSTQYNHNLDCHMVGLGPDSDLHKLKQL